MLHKVYTYNFVNGLESQSVVLLEGVEEDEGNGDAPKNVWKNSKELNQNEFELARVEQPNFFVKNADGKYGPDSAEPVDVSVV